MTAPPRHEPMMMATVSSTALQSSPVQPGGSVDPVAFGASVDDVACRNSNLADLRTGSDKAAFKLPMSRPNA